MKTIKYILELSILILNPFYCFAGSITYKEGEHIPLIFIVDQAKSESPSQDIYANVHTFDIALKAQYAAILVSRNILYNFAYRKQHWNDKNQKINATYKNTPFSNNDWELYTLTYPNYFTGENELYLLIPKAKKSLFTSIFNLTNLQKLDILPAPRVSYYGDLIKRLAPKGPIEKNPLKLMSTDLKRIFTTLPLSTELSLSIHQPKAWEGPILDIYLNGHGELDPQLLIATFSPTEIQELLTFLNNNLRIGALIISSCFVGGENLSNFKFKNDINNNKIFYPLNFIIIVESVGDLANFAPSYSLSPYSGKQFFVTIFDILQNLGKDSQHSLQSLLRELGILDLSSSGIHGEANIPQIILPGGIEIQSLTPSNNVLVLGKVKVQAAEIEKKPIYIYPKKLNPTSNHDYPLNVLLYPQIIPTPLILRASHMEPSASLRQEIKKTWGNLPTFSDIVTENINSFIKPEIYESLFTSTFNSAVLQAAQYIYPNILSMIHGNASHYFKKLIFEGNAFDGSGGIFMGIRDSFFNIGERPTLKTFYIDTLEGPNDISLILKAIRAIEGNNIISPLEKELPKDGIKVVLNNVIIATSGRAGLKASIRFQINTTAWQFDYNQADWKMPKPDQKLWSFTKIDAIKYENEYQKTKDMILNQKFSPSEAQKPLIDILKQRIQKNKELKFSSTNNLFELSSTLGQLGNIKSL